MLATTVVFQDEAGGFAVRSLWTRGHADTQTHKVHRPETDGGTTRPWLRFQKHGYFSISGVIM